jgi:hypothetical protein
MTELSRRDFAKLITAAWLNYANRVTSRITRFSWINDLALWVGCALGMHCRADCHLRPSLCFHWHENQGVEHAEVPLPAGTERDYCEPPSVAAAWNDTAVVPVDLAPDDSHLKAMAPAVPERDLPACRAPARVVARARTRRSVLEHQVSAKTPAETRALNASDTRDEEPVAHLRYRYPALPDSNRFERSRHCCPAIARR